MKEDYVDYEIAMLLKEKGFEQNYYLYPVYWLNGNNHILSFDGDDDFPYGDNECCAPSLYIAMKWLREWKHLNIEIKIKSIVMDDSPVSWLYEVYDSRNNTDWRNNNVYDTYEDACMSAIKFCVCNLIK